MGIPRNICEGQRTPCRAGVVVSTMWVLGIEFRLDIKSLYLLSLLTDPEITLLLLFETRFLCMALAVLELTL